MAGRSPADPERRAFHGRRRGRRLRAGQQGLLHDLLPALRIALPEGGGILDPRALFPERPEQVWLEIGFGGGEHLVWQAERNPDVGFIGAEYFLNGIAKLLRQVDERGLENVRILHGDVRDLLDVLPAASLDRVFVLFPDPWPKSRHHKRRLIRRATLDRLAEVMKGGVELRLATDDMGYAKWMLERLVAHPGFEWLARGPDDWRTRPADWPATRYESKALAAGRRAVYLRFARRRRG